MSPRIGLLAVAALGGLLAACANNSSTEVVAGRVYESKIQPGNMQVQVPLPDGDWRLVAWDYYTNDQDLGGVLIQTDGNRVSRMIDFYVPYITEGNPIYLRLSPYKFCARRDILYVGTSYTGSGYYFSKGAVPQDCWGINHWPVALSGSVPKHLLQLRSYVEENGLEMPITMIAVQYRRGAGKSRYVSLDYYFNPELEGIPPPEQVEWRTSDWHRDRAFHDPRKKAYIEKLKAWGTAWKEQVEKGLKGQL